MLLALKDSVTYGPVNSRRLGRSLGINLFPGSRKLCTFDCLYCQYGRARPVSGGVLCEAAVPSAGEVLAGIEEALAQLRPRPAYLTFSGNGEPTLHPGFPGIVEGVLALRGRLAPGARTAILSNSTTVLRPSVREALGRLDVRIMKLDAGDEESFRRYNAPWPGLSLQDVLAGLRRLGGVTIQALFAAGAGGNLTPKHAEAWVRAVASVRPSGVQIYTLDREAPTGSLSQAPTCELEELRRRLGGEGIRAEVFSSVRPNGGEGAAARARNAGGA
jgi:wyosine [tRNA(Phe)-imidazoG37] synthetase (radical SAM superfamily)